MNTQLWNSNIIYEVKVCIFYMCPYLSGMMLCTNLSQNVPLLFFLFIHIYLPITIIFLSSLYILSIKKEEYDAQDIF